MGVSTVSGDSKHSLIQEVTDDHANYHKEFLNDTGDVLGALSFFFSMPHINRCDMRTTTRQGLSLTRGQVL